MKTPKMSDPNNLRNRTRTPNILQNVPDRPLPSPTSSSSIKLNESGGPMSPTNTLSPNTKSIISQKLQTLKQRKLDLDKLLMEKNNLLHQLCREEGKLISSTYSLNDITNIGGGVDCGDGMNMNNNNANNNALLRRHVDTGFKLPENLLISNEDDVNQLLLSKKIQQQISQASLKMANDVTQTKSIRRAHKQNFEIAHQKIQCINNNLSMMKKCVNSDRDGGVNANNNIGYATMNMNSVINENKKVAAHDLKLKPSLNCSSTSLDNYGNGMPERRNSAVSTGSASQYLVGYSQKYRPRCDSYGGQSTLGHSTSVNNNNIDNNNCDNNSMHSPNYYQHRQIPHLHYKSHADKVAYVTKAVANAAAANSNNSSNNNNNNNSINSNSSTSSMMPSPKYGRLRPLTVDTNTSESSYYYPPNGSAANHQHRTHFQQYYTQQHSHQHRHSPYTTVHRGQTTPTTSKNASIHSQQIDVNAGNIDDDDDDDEDDIAGQYATLLTLSDQNKFSPSHHQDIDSQEAETHYSEVLAPKQTAPSPTIDRNQFQPTSKDADLPAKSQGLGGYWTTNANMERIWCSLDNRYSSLDRKCQKNKQSKKMVRNIDQPTKSTSLGNFNFINKPDEVSEATSLALIAQQNEQRRSKDKPWIETSLDGPPARKSESMSPSLVSPSIYYRDRSRLSSNSMHSPSCRNVGSMSSSSNTMTPLQSSQILSNLSKALSTSATALPGMENSISMNQQHIYHQQQQQQPLSPTYYHNTATQTPIHFENRSTNTVQSGLNSPDMPPMNTLYHESANVMTPNISPLEIQVESPKNVTIVQPAKFQPYKEVSKPFEMSDFYKYSTKFRQKTASANLTHPENTSPQLPPKNATHQMKNCHRHIHSLSNANCVDSNAPHHMQ